MLTKQKYNLASPHKTARNGGKNGKQHSCDRAEALDDEEQEGNMRKPIFKTWDYNAIPWYMLDEDMYTIEEVVYDDYDPALDGSTEYFVYLK